MIWNWRPSDWCPSPWRYAAGTCFSAGVNIDSFQLDPQLAATDVDFDNIVGSAAPAAPAPYLTSEPQHAWGMDDLVGKIASSSIVNAIDALKYAEDVLKESPTSLSNHIDQLVAACCMQLRLIFSVHLTDDKISQVKHVNEVVRLSKHLLSCVLAIFTRKSCSDLVSVGALQVC